MVCDETAIEKAYEVDVSVAGNVSVRTRLHAMQHKVGAIPFDIRGDRIAILFVTSQRRGRWILPKGTLKEDESHKQCCKREAFEEAGVNGSFLRHFPITAGIGKATGDGIERRAVTYYPLLVKDQADQWPEDAKRQRHWALLEDAEQVTDHDDLRQLILQFKSISPFVIADAKRRRAKRKE